MSNEDEVMIFSLPFDEVIQEFVPPAREEENMVSHFPHRRFLMIPYSMIQKVKK
jgi:hypothetical protein